MKNDKAQAFADTVDAAMDSRQRMERQKNHLVRLADRAVALAKSLGTDGKPLSKEDEELLRIASIPVLRVIFHEATINYLTGASVEHILADLNNILPNELL